MKFVRRRLTYANVMSTIAVFLVVAGGSALAATQLGKNTVGPKQLKKEAVTLAKIAAAAKTSLKGATGPQGPAGAKGAQGPKGEVGPSTGPAGGVLTGSFPNPGLANAAVKKANLANGSVGAAQLGTITSRGVKTAVEANSQALAGTGCQNSEEVLLEIGWIWVGAATKKLYVQNKFRFIGGLVEATNETGTEREIEVIAYCLSV